MTPLKKGCKSRGRAEGGGKWRECGKREGMGKKRIRGWHGFITHQSILIMNSKVCILIKTRKRLRRSREGEA